MKIFNNIQELWDYCLFCPICRKNEREVEVKVGPSGVFDLVLCNKKSDSLFLWCNYKNKKNEYPVEYSINCLDNCFTIKVGDPVKLDTSQGDVGKIKPYFYFWMQGTCVKCTASSVHGTDLELDIVDKKISNIKLERESIYLPDSYHVTLLHDSDIMLVSKSSSDLEDPTTIKLPLVKLDLSDQAKVINKIKTLILFS